MKHPKPTIRSAIAGLAALALLLCLGVYLEVKDAVPLKQVEPVLFNPF